LLKAARVDLVDLADLDFRAFLAIENLQQSECLKIDPVEARQADKKMTARNARDSSRARATQQPVI
jgi:hypothetical protein